MEHQDTELLTDRQLDIIRHLTYGKNLAIALRLGIAIGTVKNHIVACKRALGVRGVTRTALLMRALQLGVVTLDELVAPAHVLNVEAKQAGQEELADE